MSVFELHAVGSRVWNEYACEWWWVVKDDVESSAAVAYLTFQTQVRKSVLWNDDVLRNADMDVRQKE